MRSTQNVTSIHASEPFQGIRARFHYSYGLGLRAELGMSSEIRASGHFEKRPLRRDPFQGASGVEPCVTFVSLKR